MTTYRPKLPTTIGSLAWKGPDDPLVKASGLVHGAYLPDDYDSAQSLPVVVMVHGWGGDESVMWIFKQTLPPGVAAFTPRAPLALANNAGFVWFTYPETRLKPDPESLQQGLDKLGHFLTRLPQLYPVDPRRMVLMGFSQGAAMCNAYTVNHPGAALGLASLAGALIEMKAYEPQPQSLAGLPVFIAHGSRDETVPVAEARRARQLFAVAGAEVTYGEYPTGHKMHSQAMKDLKSWLSGVFGEGRQR